MPLSELRRLNRETRSDAKVQSPKEIRQHRGEQGELLKDPKQKPLLMEICRLGQERKWQEALLLLSTYPEPSAQLRTAALDACVKAVQLEAARKVFQEMPVKSLSAYNAMMTLLGRLRRSREVEQLFQEMQQQNHQPSVVTYGTLIGAYGMAKDLQKVLQCLDEMKQRSIVPNEVVYCSAMGACARVGEKAEAQRLFQEMQTLQVQPNVAHFSSLVASCTKTKDEALARQHIAEMRRRGIPHSVVSFTALLSCLSGEGAVAKAEAILAELREAKLEPDVFVYNSFLNVIIKEGRDATKARAVLAEMQAKGMRPNRETEIVEGRLRELEREGPGTALLPPGWLQHVDAATGAPYYWRESDPENTVTWTRPTA